VSYSSLGHICGDMYVGKEKHVCIYVSLHTTTSLQIGFLIKLTQKMIFLRHDGA
jgi:hypothetical protein